MGDGAAETIDLPHDVKTVDKEEELISVDRLIEEAGLNPAELSPEIKKRLELLDKKTRKDAEDQMIDGKKVLEYLNVDPGEKQKWSVAVSAGSILSDIGKSGPLGATDDEINIITQMYSIDNIDPKISIQTFINTYLPDLKGELPKLEELLKRSSPDLKLESTMRLFFNEHSNWTLDVLQNNKEGIPPEVIAAAASHHRIQKINPRNIFNGDSDTYVKPFGSFVEYNWAGMLVTVLDLYNAFQRRGAKTPEEAAHDVVIGKVRNVISKGAYAANLTMTQVIDATDNALKPETIEEEEAA